MVCDDCGARLTVDTGHRFTTYDGRTVRLLCRGCCPRCDAGTRVTVETVP